MADHFPRTPSGLFPSRPPRPTYREPNRVRGGALSAGLGAGAAWMLFFGLLADSLRTYVLWSVLAGAIAWAATLILIRQGDRGVAAGVAISLGVAWSAAAIALAVRWGTSGDWPLW
ncbi:hypothetical protein GCM10022251_04010 [Phytohabitans flavus]|uniref:Uncharacterized protein n=1 Tax=Phytohabitans flavus TaxID=1076124 RepID=A0A6F8Y335_9ACTN|nr:hypothetical protein [Phytohabitans flavus]BCB80443.1 hypothetical protein Pflav_068530 [Phytohabitans flavus]